MKQIRWILGFALLLTLIVSLCLPGFAGVNKDPLVARTEGITTKASYTLRSGVTESSLTLDGGHKAYMLQIAPAAEASLKASFSKYFTDDSTKASRSKAVSSLGFSTMTTTAQAAAYETATGRDVIFTMNGNFFDTDTKKTRGYLVVEGNEIHEPDSDCICYFAVLKDGSYDIRAYTEAHDDVAEAVAGRQWLVKNGVQMTQNKTQLSARTAIGLKADGTVVCFVVDGKTNSTGVTINDMCGVMYSLGCVEAINLDGGGSSTFVTQRSSGTLQIRNQPSDSSGERPVVSTLMLVAEPDSDHLYFDFTDNTAAIDRYKADIYGGLNYDSGNWHYHHTYNTAPSFDHNLGTMSFTTTASCPTTRDIHPVITSNNSSYTSGHPLSYVPTGEDYFKIRMRIDGSTDTEADFRLLYASDDGTSSSNNAFDCKIPAGAINNGYFVLEGNANFGGVDTVAAIRPEVYNLLIADPGKKPVTFTFDYIYVGPKTGSESRGALYFDFDNNAQALERYDSISYGFLNFNSPDKPFWATTYNSSATNFAVDPNKGTLRVSVTDGYSGSAADGNLTYGPWIKNTNSYGNFTGRNTYGYFPLSYDPSHAEVMQIRFRTENCVAPEGTVPRAVLEYYYIDDQSYGYKNDIRQTFALSEEYQTLTVAIPSTFTSADVIKCFGFRFQNIMSHSTGTIEIDYIYIGPACGGPEPQHNWHGGQVTLTPTCTEEGIETYTCTLCKETKTLMIPATGHSFCYTPKDGQLHSLTCANCDLAQEEAHNFAEGLCICGEQEVKEPIQASNWNLSHTLNLASDISVNFVIHESALTGFDMDSVFVESTIETYEGNMQTGTRVFRLEAVKNSSLYYFTMNGLTAVNMNDRIRSVLYGTKDGQAYYSPVDEYSIATYAYAQLDKDYATRALKTLCAELLRYGALAQSYKGYRTEALADHAMTEAHRAYLSPLEAVEFGNTNETLQDTVTPSVIWAGKTLSLESKGIMKYVFTPGTYAGNIEELSLRISYTNVVGETVTAVVTQPEVYSAAAGLYAFSFDGLLAAELRSVLSARIYAGQIPVSETMVYSLDTYGNGKIGTLGELCKALFAYSDSAKQFFQS